MAVAAAAVVPETRDARDDDEERPGDVHKPPREYADLREEEFEADDDRKYRDGAAVGAMAPRVLSA